MLILLLAGCPSFSEFGRVDTVGSFVDTSSTSDNDQDGYSPRQGDCDDGDASINPGATETVNDGVDSNCDGEDDT